MSASGPRRAGFAAALVVTVTIGFAAVLVLIAVQLLVVHTHITGIYAGLVNQQSQTVKTDVYVLAFLVVLPLALIAGPRIADALAGRLGAEQALALSALLAGALAAMLIVIRLSGGLPWGAGVRGIAVGVGAWAILAVLACGWTLTRGGPAAAALGRRRRIAIALAALLGFGALLCVTSSRSLGVLPLALGALLAAIAIGGYERFALPRLGRLRWAIDAIAIALLLLAIPDLVVFRNPTGIPEIYFDPGIVQFQMDYILGPTNQLLGGGALLVGDPVSQYGVGMIYFLAGWFHIAPIGYGTFGFLDGLLTALFYAAGYAVLRLAGVRRTLAVAVIALAVLAFVYNFGYFVGQLPEEGPLRFGMPMLVLLGALVAARLPRVERYGRALMLVAIGISAVWALEAFVYTAVTYAGVLAAQTWLRAPGQRRRQAVRGARDWLGACVCAQALFALATLIGSGQLPAWGQYLDYARQFLLGGSAGSITYGFATWGPGLAVYGAALASAAAVVLLLARRPAVARAHPVVVVALAGTTAYAIAILSYTDNRSSTYLFLYVALPLLLAGALWLALLLAPGYGVSLGVRRAGLAGALAVAVLLFAGAWPQIATHFERTALAKAHPGGGLRAAVDRLWHPPAIDPRTPVGIELLNRYVHARRVVILLPEVPDLGTEILIRSHRANLLPIGDPKADGLVPAVFVPRVGAAVARLRAGQRLLIDVLALKVIADLRRPGIDLLRAPIDGGGVESEWILHALDRRFAIRPIAHAPDGLIVAQLAAR